LLLCRVTVRLPADARLYVNGVLCPLTSAERSFETPPLRPGRRYSYTLKAVVSRGGEDLDRTHRIDVRAGAAVEADLRDGRFARTARPESGSGRCQVTVLLPADALLYVDDVLCPLTTARRWFETPELAPGRRYAYTLRVEWQSGGVRRSQSRRVIVEANKAVTVRFREDDLAEQADHRPARSASKGHSARNTDEEL
jgi:uncharacterized protein (TIGR03000 family)